MSDNYERAKEQAQAQFNFIVEALTAFNIAQKSEFGAAEFDGEVLTEEKIITRIQELPLSLEIQSCWHSPGQTAIEGRFQILLCTGGPAVRIIGDLDKYYTPDSARLQMQDWLLDWKDFWLSSYDEEILLDFSRLFSFSE